MSANAAYTLQLDAASVPLTIAARKPALAIEIDGIAHSVVELPAGDGRFTLIVDGKTYSGWRYAARDQIHVRLGGRTYIVDNVGSAGAGAQGAANSEIRADMPGTLVAAHVTADQAVKAGERLVTIESMKLQLTLISPRDGIVAAVHVAPNTAFEKGALLVSLVPQTPPQQKV